MEKSRDESHWYNLNSLIRACKNQARVDLTRLAAENLPYILMMLIMMNRERKKIMIRISYHERPIFVKDMGGNIDL